MEKPFLEAMGKMGGGISIKYSFIENIVKTKRKSSENFFEKALMDA